MTKVKKAIAMAAPVDLYETDFHTWTETQAKLMRSGQIAQADLENIAEEIESLGKSQLAELRSRYKVLCMHLLKRMFQAERDGRSWTTTITDQRIEIEQLLVDNPGMKPKKQKVFEEAYKQARRLAAAETKRPIAAFPEIPPFTIEQVEADGFWPPAAV